MLLVNLPLDDPSPSWTNMTNHIATGDISGAIQYFSSVSAANYRQAFLSVGTNTLIPIISQIPSIAPSVVGATDAEYYFTNTVDGQIITFPIEFVKENGSWKIMEY